ncbi:helix-turn-helix transcriptional regulator [Microbacterium schleiferi]|uniref:Helix-turn-helix transcriptional regulator n=1 Tax=Microbacterium schleiferi TaxID=69362 RepID=A0A7S8MZ77_9MICO|nr:helix-turn-helix transcriptional regulator [Microbacterium schleiferi]
MYHRLVRDAVSVATPDDDLWTAYVEALGVSLSRARADRGLSQERVAHAAGISTFTYRKLEKGESNPGTPANPRLRTLVSLAEVLDVPLRSILPPDARGIAPGR